ncbi:hypothetical protein H4R19_000942 [Coemansia spiralis]|nr:hypothetical protein H4R19_000942 [Coemansia spiralis]
MNRARLANSLGLALATLACWLYALHLYAASRKPLPLPSDDAPPAERAFASGGADVGDSSDGILTFVHVSDLHISRYAAAGGLVHFQHFLATAVPLVAPRVVAITGDLTDGKGARLLSTAQQPAEWDAYQRAVAPLRGRFNGTFLRDQRGNHDCLDVFAEDAPENMFRTHSVVGDSSGYLLQIEEPYGRYAFVAADACPTRGVARPMNFFGYLDPPHLRALEQRMAAARGANHTFLLSHYPTTTMAFGRRTPAALLRQVSVLLCGHLHQLVAGLGRQLQTYHARDGFWELEIGDMKQHALYRIYAIDHDLVSFVDATLPLPAIPLPNPARLDAHVDQPLPHPPVVLVTSPKDARYLLPRHEPLANMRASSFIRMLVWADQPVARVEIEIDGKRHPHPAVYRGAETANPAGDVTKTPLWVAPWDPAYYDDGVSHTLTVTVADAAGKTTVATVPFSLSGQLLPLHNGLSGGWIMSHDAAAILRASSVVIYLLACTLLLVAPRAFYALLPDGLAVWLLERTALHCRDRAAVQNLRDRVTHGPGRVWSRPVLRLAATGLAAGVRVQCTRQVHWASIPWLFWPAYALTMALATLPLFVGRLIPSAGALGIGSVYAVGIRFTGEWVPLADSWLHAVGVAVPLLVLLLYLPMAVEPPGLVNCDGQPQASRWYRARRTRIGMLVFVILALGGATANSAIAYGWGWALLGVGRLWFFVASTAALYIVDWKAAGT